jgi:AraC family ethanolamine operon transcriptional activator
MDSMSGHVTISQATDIAEMVTLQPQWRLSYQQLSAGRYAGRIVHASLPELHLTQETSNKAARQQGSLYEDDVGLALARSPGGACRFHGQLAGGDVVMAGLGRELDLTTPDECELLAALMPRTVFMGMLWQWHPRLAEKASTAHMTVRLSPGQAHHLRSLMQGLLRVLVDQPTREDHFAVRHVSDALVLAWQDALTGQAESDHGGGNVWIRLNRRDLVERACQHVRDGLLHHHQPLPTMLDLCKALGASPRKLEYCFRDVLGMSPARYLRLMRLNGAHHDLVYRADDEVTVQEVALRWGFWHLGAFASDYRRMFGRLPSHTLACLPAHCR